MHFKRIIALWSSHKDFLNTNSARHPAGRKVISVTFFGLCSEKMAVIVGPTMLGTDLSRELIGLQVIF